MITGSGTKELQPQFVNQKSFYKKAEVLTEFKIVDGQNVRSTSLYSYGRFVAFTTMIAGEPSTKSATVFNTYSKTTLKHIKEFLLQEGFKADNAKQIMKDYWQDKYTN